MLKDTQVHCARSVDTQGDPWSLESKFMGGERGARAVTLGTPPPPAGSRETIVQLDHLKPVSASAAASGSEESSCAPHSVVPKAPHLPGRATQQSNAADCHMAPGHQTGAVTPPVYLLRLSPVPGQPWDRAGDQNSRAGGERKRRKSGKKDCVTSPYGGPLG